VGYHAALFLQELGAVIVGLIEYEGAIHNPDGMDVLQVVAHRQATKSILDFPGAKNLKSGPEGLELDCDILVPAALENQITADNAPRIRARMIVEGANGPTTSRASELLSERGVLILPDHYANAGGVLVSYFEWLKNLSHVRFGRMEKRFDEKAFSRLLGAVSSATGKQFSGDEQAAITHGAEELDLVNSGLEETMSVAYHRLWEIRNQHKGVDLRTAAFLDAIDKIAVCYQDLGIFP
jgi:glutamate dehydrogenase (NAD(P)+)